MLIGLIAALCAALVWGLNFIVPFLIDDYTIFDLALFQFAISGLLSLGFLIFSAKRVRSLRPRDWGTAFLLGVVGYLGYFLALTGAAIYAGPIIAPAFVGLVPVVLAIAGNLRQRTIAWRKLALPLIMAAAGLILVNGSGLEHGGILQLHSLSIGIPLAILSVTLWTCYGLLNQSALARRPEMSASLWTALMMAGASLGMLVFLPIGLTMGVFHFQQLGLHWEVAASLYVCAAAASILINVGGALAWTIASQRLPVALAAQMITMEPTFGTIYGLLLQHRWPRLLEIVGMTTLLVGVVIAIRVFHGKDETDLTAAAA